MFRAFRIFVLFFLYISALRSVGQEEYAVKRFTTENGLPHNHVYSIAQDQNGFLWIATFDGLSRWNGYEFRNYYHNPADSTSISYFQVEDVLVDAYNNVWVCSPGFLALYNRSTDNFRQFRDRIYQSHKTLDRAGNFWCTSFDKVFRWDQKKQDLQPIEIPAVDGVRILSKNYQNTVSFDQGNRLWISSFDVSYTKGWYYVFDWDGQRASNGRRLGVFNSDKIYKEFGYPITFNYKTVASKGKYWIFSNVGLYELDTELKEFVRVDEQAAGDVLNGLSEAIKSELAEYRKFMFPVTKNDHQRRDPDEVGTEAYFVDQSQIVWSSPITKGSQSNGLVRRIPVNSGFHHYFLDKNPPDRLNSFFPVLKDRFGNFWAGLTNVNRLYSIDENGIFSEFQPVEATLWPIVRQPRDILQDSSGIWIGYFHDLLLKYDYKTRKFHQILLKESGVDDRSLPKSLVHLTWVGESILICGFKDICLFNPRTNQIQHFVVTELKTNLNFFSIIPDAKNGWWVGCNYSTLIHFDSKFQEIGRYTVGAPKFNVEDLILGEENDIWLSTLGGGLAHFNYNTGQTRVFTTADGLSNNTCYGMLKDKKGILWISTNHGISRFDPKTEQFRIFNADDGLKIDEFNSDNTFMAPDGELFFAGMGGVVSFYPDSLDRTNQSGFIAPLVIEDFMVSGVRRFFNKPVYECDTVILKKGDDNFQVNFACLDFRSTEKIKYRYRLTGEDDRFFETDYRHRFLNYSSLNPGRYQLEIEATNIQGDWASKQRLWIVIPPFFYQTWLFRIAVTVFIVLVIMHFLYSYNHRIRTRAREKQDELRLESLRGQMNPHFIFNSLNSINYFISQNDRLSANRYIADFSRLIRSILGNMASDYIPLSKELESIRDYLRLEHLRFGNKFDYSIVVPDHLNSDELMVSPGMIQPFIENAIWHGVRALEDRKGVVSVEFQKEAGDHLTCVVTDDGVGRERSEKCKSHLPGKTSRGINIVLERLKIINSLRKSGFRIMIENLHSDRDETGTRVKIEIPLKK